MWQVNQPLSEDTRYTQLEDGRWKAEYNGFVKITAEGQTPTESEVQLNRAMDALLASLIRGGKDRPPQDGDAFIASLMLSDAITVVRNTASKTARFKQKNLRPFSTSSEAPREATGPVNPKRTRKSR
jgi:predicted RNase H-like HicB family nuclease